MAGFRDRVRNLFDDHQSRELASAKRQTAEQIRGQLLGQALQMKQEWAKEIRGYPAGHQLADTHYSTRLEQINAALEAVKVVEPSVVSRVEVAQFRNMVHEEAFGSVGMHTASLPKKQLTQAARDKEVAVKTEPLQDVGVGW